MFRCMRAQVLIIKWTKSKFVYLDPRGGGGGGGVLGEFGNSGILGAKGKGWDANNLTRALIAKNPHNNHYYFDIFNLSVHMI